MPRYYGMPIIRTGKCHCWGQLGKQPSQSYGPSLETWFSAEALLFSLALLVTAPDFSCSGQYSPASFHPLYDSFHPSFYLKGLTAIF